MEAKNIIQFQKTVWNFYKKNKRSFPWRKTADPYHILVSEIMLQQTQADRVVPFYQRFIKKFPTFQKLSKASFGEVYPYWQGLGYNRRAMALKKLAKVVVEKYDRVLPKSPELLQELPGIGPYTARAVSIFSYNRPLICLETNIRRVYIYHFFSDTDGITDKEILEIAERACPTKPWRSREWHWALMDYGAYLKNKVENPNRHHKNYSVQSKFEGSSRQIRGAILRKLAEGPHHFSEITKELSSKVLENFGTKRVEIVLENLQKEGFIEYKNKKYLLK